MSARSSTHAVLAEHHFEARSSECFDRIDYAVSLLRLLKPRLTVAVYPRSRHLVVERGSSRASGATWATFGVPPHATREGIASAVASLSDRDREPFLVDWLCRAESSSL